MGFLAAVPALLSAGAGAVGTAAAGASAGTWLTLASTAAQVYGQRQSTGAQEVQLKLEQRQEKLAASDREVQRQRRLTAILGSQRAEIAAAGVVASGSIANVSLVDAKRANEDSQVDRLNTSTRITALRANATAIRRAGNIKSATTILSAGERMYNRGDFDGVGGGASGGRGIVAGPTGRWETHATAAGVS